MDQFGNETAVGQAQSSCDKTKDPIFQLCDQIRETAYAIHNYHRSGHFEKVYENALMHRLRKQGIRAKAQVGIEVRDEDGTILGEYFADLLVEDALLVEAKACKSLVEEHIAQTLGYLRGCGLQHALLINFGAPKLQISKLVLYQR